MVSFTLLGLLIDWGLGTTPGFTIGLTILGLFAAFFHLTRMAKSMAAKNGPSGGTGTGAGGGA
jgi:F0F1-type ATP synthase assembly protein I